MLLGFVRGGVSEVLSLLAWVLAVILGRQFAPVLAPELAGWVPGTGLQYLAAFALIVVVVLVLAAVLRFLISSLLRAVGLGFLDRFIGSIFGFARGVLVVVLCVAAGGLTSFPREIWWREAMLAPPLETAVVALKPWMPSQWASKIRYH